MQVLVQKVLNASVSVEGQVVAAINSGYLLFIGIEKGDTEIQADYLANKVINLRIFTDENDKMNLSIKDTGGAILAVSQFTLAADVSRGNRPGFETTALPDEAQKLYNYFVEKLKTSNLEIKTGIFQADMKVSLINDGPCTFLLHK